MILSTPSDRSDGQRKWHKNELRAPVAPTRIQSKWIFIGFINLTTRRAFRFINRRNFLVPQENRMTLAPFCRKKPATVCNAFAWTAATRATHQRLRAVHTTVHHWFYPICSIPPATKRCSTKHRAPTTRAEKSRRTQIESKHFYIDVFATLSRWQPRNQRADICMWEMKIMNWLQVTKPGA